VEELIELLKKANFYYPYISIEIYSDGSGDIHSPSDHEVGNISYNFPFNNIDQALSKLKELGNASS